MKNSVIREKLLASIAKRSLKLKEKNLHDQNCVESLKAQIAKLTLLFIIFNGQTERQNLWNDLFRSSLCLQYLR